MNMHLLSRYVDVVLGFVRTKLNREWFLANDAFLTNLANTAVLINAILGFVLSLIVGIKTDSLRVTLFGLVWVLIFTIGFWIASRLVLACSRLIKHSRTSINGTELPECFALIFIFVAVINAFVGILQAINSSTLDPLYFHLSLAIGSLYFTSLLLNLDLLNVEVRTDATAGEEAISVFILLSKAAVRLAGVFFGLLSAIGAVALTILVFQLLAGSYNPLEFLEMGMLGAVGALLALAALAAPLSLYFSYLLFALFSDVFGALIRSAPAPVRGSAVRVDPT